MELSAEMFQRTLESLRSDGPIGFKEQRANPRVGMRSALRIILRAVNSPPTVTDLWLHDISRDGIGLLHERPIPVGSKYVVQLPRPDETPLTLLCTVMNCREIKKGLWSIGSSFTEVVPSNTWKQNPVADATVLPRPDAVTSRTDSNDDEKLRRLRAAVIGDS